MAGQRRHVLIVEGEQGERFVRCAKRGVFASRKWRTARGKSSGRSTAARNVAVTYG